MIWQLYCCLTALCVYRQINSYQPPSGYLSITRSASGGSARDLRRQQAQGVPKARKKAGFVPTGAVCRSCTTLPVSIRAPPPEGKAVRLSRISSIRHRHLAGRVPRAKRLGRSQRSEIPVQETCTQRRLIDRYDFKVPVPAPCRSGIPGAKQDRGGISKNAEMRLAIPKSSGMLKESAT